MLSQSGDISQSLQDLPPPTQDQSTSHINQSLEDFPDQATQGQSLQVPPSNDNGDELPEFTPATSMLTRDRKVSTIATVFPAIPSSVIRRALHQSDGSIDRAVNSLLRYRSSEEEIEVATAGSESGSEIADQVVEERANEENCAQVFQRLKKKMHPRGMREKLKVDAEEQVMDVYSYYKSADFDALAPISVMVKGQPAIDTGGVLRQVFGEVFLSLCNNEGIKHIFTGEPYRRIPMYSNQLVVNGFFEVLGKIISHSLVQGGPGFPYLSPPIYWYLATADLQTALSKASCADVTNEVLLNYIDKVNIDMLPVNLLCVLLTSKTDNWKKQLI